MIGDEVAVREEEEHDDNNPSILSPFFGVLLLGDGMMHKGQGKYTDAYSADHLGQSLYIVPYYRTIRRRQVCDDPLVGWPMGQRSTTNLLGGVIGKVQPS